MIFSGTPTLGPTEHVIESGPENVWNMTTLLVPGAGFNTLQITLGASGNAGLPGADSCYLDAIVLVQKGTASVAQGHKLGAAGACELSESVFIMLPERMYKYTLRLPVSDCCRSWTPWGMRWARVPLGAISMGDQDVSLALEHAGIFFLRLFVDGAPVGSPLEISGE